MANPFAQHETYEETITDPRDGEEWTVTLRTLNAGDEAKIRDETRIEIDESDGESMRVPMGTLRLRTVELALVTWTLPMALSRGAIECLHDGIFHQIYEKTKFASADVGAKADGAPPTETPADASSLEPAVAAVS